MRFKARRYALGVAACVLAFVATASAQEKRAITFKDLISMHRVSDPQISPDGKWVAYQVDTPDYPANHMTHDIWIVAISGGNARQLTHDGVSERPRWSPDGKRVAILSSSGETPQVALIPPMAAHRPKSPRFPPAPTTSSGRRTAGGSHSSQASIPIATTMPATPPATQPRRKIP